MRFEGTDTYIATEDLMVAVNAALALERPLLVKGEPGTGKTRLAEEVAASLERMSQVEALYTVSGKIDLVAILRVRSPQELDAALDRIGELDGVRDTDSNIVLSTKFDRR